MKAKEDPITTATYDRKGDILYIKGITGNIRIIGQHTVSQKNRKSKNTNSVKIEAKGNSKAHDNLQIHVRKSTIQIVCPGMKRPPYYDLSIVVSSGISIKLEDVSGSVVIEEAVNALVVVGQRPCRIYTELLRDAMFDISTNVNINIKRLFGHCNIDANSNARVEIRDANISTLSVDLGGSAWVDIHGSARFAKLDLKYNSYFRINSAELVERKKGTTATLDLGWTISKSKSKKRDDIKKQHDSINRGNAEILQFTKDILSEAVPPPLAINT